MKQSHRFISVLAVFLLFAGLTSGVSAFTVSSITVNPPGEQAAGTPVTIDLVIDFPSGGTETFPSESELQLSTNLNDPHWEPALVLNGVKTNLLKNSGRSLIIKGYYLSYTRGQNVQLRLTLTGNLPTDLPTGQNLVKIQELDSGDNVISAAYVEMPAAPATTTSAPTKNPATQTIIPSLPADTPTPKSPLGTGAGLIALMIAALFVIMKK